MDQAAAASFCLRMLGPFQVERDGQPLPRLRSRKGHWLLALLILRPGREVERAWLAGTLWPDSPAAQALANLRNSLRDLRRALGSDAARLRSPTPQTLALDLTSAWVDLLAFDVAAARGDEASLRQAVALYRGPLLEGCVEEWVFPERQAREEAVLRALETLAGRAMAAGDAASAAGHLRRGAAVDPLREETQRALMEALAAGGNITAAMEVYRELRERLHRELNAAPDPATRQRCEELRAEARAGVRRQTKDGGRGRLHDGGAASGAAAPSRPSAVCRPPSAVWPLPVPLSSFVGRETQIADLRQWLAGPVRLVTLTGAGGCGKTRLALQVAAALQGDFADGVPLIDLTPIREPALAASAVARGLGVRETGGASVTDSLLAFLRDRQMLLVLDNFEQILAAAPLVTELLQGAPRLKVLVTSRAPLRLRGEQEYPVPPLALPEPARLPPAGALGRYAALELFIQRAAAARPGFAMSEENAPAIAQICLRLDGLPLAIELAAARVKLFPPPALLARLDSRLTLLVGGARDLPARQQTLRDAIGWSYALLTPAEQMLFRRLAVFVGGWTPAAAEAVCLPTTRQPLPTDVVGGLMSLVDKSLIRPAEGTGGEPRMQMLETIREYAAEQLAASDERDALRQRHAQFCRRAVEAPGSLDVMDIDNYRAALVWAVESGDAETGLRLAAALHWFWWCHGLFAEGQEILEKLLALPGAAGRTALRARALDAAAWMTKTRPSKETARAYLEECRSIWQELGNPVGVAGCLLVLGQIADSPAAAQALFEEGAAVAQAANDFGAAAGCVQNLGHLAQDLGDWDKAGAYYAESLALYRAGNGHANNIAEMQSLLAEVAWHGAQYEEAAALYRESLAGHRRSEMPNQMAVARTLWGFGRVLARAGAVQNAVRLWGAACRIEEEVGGDGAEPRALAEQAQPDAPAREAAWQAGRVLTLEQALVDAQRLAGLA